MTEEASGDGCMPGSAALAVPLAIARTFDMLRNLCSSTDRRGPASLPLRGAALPHQLMHSSPARAAGRYHLYVSLACPWASRCVAGLYLKGLEESIGLSVTHPTWQRTRPDSPDDTHAGWTFASPGDTPFTPVSGHGSVDCAGCVPDPHYHAKNVRQLYELAEDTFGKMLRGW